jgi:RimJ/RimL family protein N-acetyltransferase
MRCGLLKKALPWFRREREDKSQRTLFLRGAKVVLRDKLLEDAKNDYFWRTDVDLSKLDATMPIKMSYGSFIKFSRGELDYPNSSSKRLAVDTFDGVHIGNCMYYDIDPRGRQAELGIMIGDRRYQGRGYGTDAVQVLLCHIFETTPIDRVYLHTLEWNARARSSFEKAGFREVKNIRREGMHFVKMDIHKCKWQQPRTI